MKAIRILFTIFFLLFKWGAFSNQVTLNVTLSNPVLLADREQSVYLKVGLTGFEMISDTEEPPANVAIVLDRSGSMDGEKLERAKEAAILAVTMLKERDIVSVVTYSDTVSVLVPATRVSNRTSIIRKIESLRAGGSTALFAGVSKGSDEVSKFLDRNKVNRVILLSDGLANVGPDSPTALGNLGEVLKESGISVSTIGLGLGYNEDLMVKLAARSGGNHAFVENYNDLARIFQAEFKTILSVVAQNVEIEIQCPDGVRPLRIIGREAEIIGNKVYTDIAQLYSNQEKYLMVELQVPAYQAGSELDIAQVSISYNNLESGRNDQIQSLARAQFSPSEKTVRESIDKDTLVEAIVQVTAEANEQAIELRDKGQIEEAQELLKEQAQSLFAEAEELQAPVLRSLGSELDMESEILADEEDWNANRKRMKAENYEVQSQQQYDEDTN